MTAWCLLLGLFACSGDHIPTSPEGPPQNRLVASVSIRPSGVVVAPDETARLEAVVRSARGRVVNGQSITWSSSDESILRIDPDGTIAAGREGTAEVTATVSGVRSTTTVDVRGTVVGIEVVDPERTLQEGEVEQLSASYVYENGAVRQAANLHWLSRDGDVAAVDAEGRVLGRMPGRVEIHVKGRGRQARWKVKVAPVPVKSVDVQGPTARLEVGDATQLWADVRGPDGNRLNRAVTWSSSSPAVAAVSDDGHVTAVKEGTVTITASVDGVQGSESLRVSGSASSGGSGGEGSSGGDGGGSGGDDGGSGGDNGGSGGEGGSSGGDDGSSGATVSSPGQVSDLRVVGSDERSVTLRFTEVDDGTGQPANYAVRYDVDDADWGWGSALDVSSGTCRTPLQGSGAGSTVTCTVEELQPGTRYRFRMVAYRGSLNLNAEFGGLSNTAEGTTGETSAEIDVVPSSFELEVGKSRQLEAYVTDAYGNPLEATVSWVSTRSAVASVDGSGNVTGNAAGDATIRASALGVSGSSSARIVAPPPPPSGSSGSGGGSGGGGSSYGSSAFGPGSNEPAGLMAFYTHDASNKDMGAFTGSAGDPWSYGSSWGDKDYATEPLVGGNMVTVVDDPGTPSGKAQRHLYPAGHNQGFSGAVFWNDWRGYRPDPSIYPGWNGQVGELSELYIRTMIKFEPDWTQHHTATEKLFYWGKSTRGGGASAFYLQHRGSGGGLRFRDQGGGAGGVSQGVYDAPGFSLPTGRWFQLEIWMESQSALGRADGSLKVWVDGTLVGTWKSLNASQPSGTTDFQNVAGWYDTSADILGLVGIQYGLFWGGSHQRIQRDQHIRYGGLYLSGKP